MNCGLSCCYSGLGSQGFATQGICAVVPGKNGEIRPATAPQKAPLEAQNRSYSAFGDAPAVRFAPIRPSQMRSIRTPSRSFAIWNET